jgi:two-component system chemotaxis response regulator CheY
MRGTNKIALVVDDDMISRLVTRHVLVGAGYSVLEAEDGRSALRALDRIPVDLLVTDFNMPGMNGIALVRAMRDLPAYGDLRVIMLSSESSDEIRRECLAAGIAAWLAKPLQPKQMLNLLAA